MRERRVAFLRCNAHQTTERVIIQGRMRTECDHKIKLFGVMERIYNRPKQQVKRQTARVVGDEYQNTFVCVQPL
jgi:hypothetical protein